LGNLLSLIILQEMAGFPKTIMRLPFRTGNFGNQFLLCFTTAQITYIISLPKSSGMAFRRK
jgi:hypothetical protein